MAWTNLFERFAEVFLQSLAQRCPRTMEPDTKCCLGNSQCAGSFGSALAFKVKEDETFALRVGQPG